ncbi:MAG: DUF2206 domain-containing protein [Candidatus Methanoperedens sp.]|nr:DUF2206 domain-containing protein [Candidatus Methanoperedens sp.]
MKIRRLRSFNANSWFISILLILFITDLTIYLDIPILRQILGFIFLMFLPGLLTLKILKLYLITVLEKFILVWGLSISLLLLIGLIINTMLLWLNFSKPLAIIPLLLSFNIVFIILLIVGYNNSQSQIFSVPNFNLSIPEKAFLSIPVLFPGLSVFGMNLMNKTNNNIILMLLLFLIPFYVVIVCIFNKKFPNRLYPFIIFLISISLLLLLALRSNHLIGIDTHSEYNIYQITLNNLHWKIISNSPYDATLSISLLPVIFRSILNIPDEFLFKILHSVLYSISPLLVYVISKKYIGDFYGFLASCFFMFQSIFLFTAYNARTSLAVLFVCLMITVLFTDTILGWRKKFFTILFIVSTVISHYSTTYILFFILVSILIFQNILLIHYNSKKVISSNIVILFGTFMLFWYSKVTSIIFNGGIYFVNKTILSLNDLFINDMRSAPAQFLLGSNNKNDFPENIKFIFIWLTFVFIGIGIITLIRRYKNMSFPELNFKKSDFLIVKFEVAYSVMVFVCAGLLAITIILPYISIGYGIERLYALTIISLSVFFIIGGITLSKYTKTRSYLIILLVLIPHYFSVVGVTPIIFGDTHSIILNSVGIQYDQMYVHDQESYSAKWLKRYLEENARLYGDTYSKMRLISQSGIQSLIYAKSLIEDKENIEDGYIYLRYTGVVDKKLMDSNYKWHNMTEYRHIFIGKNKIYSNGGSEVHF